MKKQLKNSKDEMFVKLLLGTIKAIPTIHPSKRTVREVRKVYDSLIKPKYILPKEKSFTKDTTKFVLEGKKFGKGRFALNVIKSFIEKKNPTLAQLKTEFPDELTMIKYKTLGLIREIPEVVYKDRYFMDDTLTTSDGKRIVVCSQFGIANIMPMFKKAQKLGFDVKKVSK